MIGSPSQERRERADRILDTAKDLLLRWGYRRVTVDELARRSGVGKGTIYLHWRSREEVFRAVAAREGAAMMETVVAAVRADPAEVALHRYMRRQFVEAMSRPVLRAVFTRDAETLGAFLDAPAHRRLEETKRHATREYLAILAAEGLLRPDLRAEDLDYSLTAVVFGFFAIESLLPPGTGLELEQKAGHVADAVHRMFEPAAAPARSRLERAARKADEVLTVLNDGYRRVAYGGGDDE